MDAGGHAASNTEQGAHTGSLPGRSMLARSISLTRNMLVSEM
jgi:hypothetical protein